jgi:predicted aldo/keto reductase-like oxidoreductase
MPSHPSALDRRSFLRLGMISTAGAAIGCASPVGEAPRDTAPREMKYRPLGKTGLRVSEVSFGAHGVDNPALMAAAMDAGINTIMTSGSYMDGREEEALGEAIRTIGGRREKLVLVTGEMLRPGATRQGVLNSIDASLRRLRTDRLEVYCTFQVESPDNLRVDALFEAFEEARRAGKVLHLGLSGHHGGMQACLNAAIDDGRFEAFFTRYDFVSYPDVDQILRRAAQRGIGTVVFKTKAGNRQKEIKDLEAGGLSFPQATVKWALTNPDVASVCVTISSFDQIRTYTAAVGSKLEGAEVAMLRRYAEEMYDKYCRSCRTCEASCPRGVAVADVMRYAMYFKHYSRQKDAMRLYASLPAERTSRACDDCRGECEGKCPFGLEIREGLREAHAALSFA